MEARIESLLAELESFKKAIVRSEQRVKEAEARECKECPQWKEKANGLAGKYFGIIKELKQELRNLKKDCSARIDAGRQDIKEQLLTKLKLQLLQMQRRDQLLREELVTFQHEHRSSDQKKTASKSSFEGRSRSQLKQVTRSTEPRQFVINRKVRDSSVQHGCSLNIFDVHPSLQIHEQSKETISPILVGAGSVDTE